MKYFNMKILDIKLLLRYGGKDKMKISRKSVSEIFRRENISKILFFISIYFVKVCKNCYICFDQINRIFAL